MLIHNYEEKIRKTYKKDVNKKVLLMKLNRIFDIRFY